VHVQGLMHVQTPRERPSGPPFAPLRNGLRDAPSRPEEAGDRLGFVILPAAGTPGSGTGSGLQGFSRTSFVQVRRVRSA
jgi:hypothetical protein